ncbi:OLC1v1018100C1 [Oldenlandia corymbosa var. corymbosa]|uniref:OLC1v1018100C1 n=1 Tax=Oldenlandia corymbosa var. corymbosa TaxID=529605 RepID=A0AAV1EB72_OLDCO|nr:OLC1v1018100C1 [Oldenlandia corymbosa var. corymbosa]
MQKASQQSLLTPTAKFVMDLLLKPTAIDEEPSTTVDQMVLQSGHVITAAVKVATSIDELLQSEAVIAPIATTLDEPLSCVLETNLQPAETLDGSTSGLTMAEKIAIPVDIPDNPPFLEDAPPGEGAVGIELKDTLCNQPDSPIAVENHHLPSALMAAASKSGTTTSPDVEIRSGTPVSNSLIVHPPSAQQNPVNDAVDRAPLVSKEDKMQADSAATAPSADKSLTPSNQKILTQNMITPNQHVPISNEKKTKSNSPSMQISRSSSESIFFENNKSSSSKNSIQRLNPEAPEFTVSPQPILEVLLPLTAPKLYLSKDDTEIWKNTETFNPNYLIEDIQSEGGLNHASNDSDNDFDMEYAMEQESFYSEVSAPTYHNRSKKAKAKKKVQVHRSARLNKD